MRVLHVVPTYIPAWRYGGPIRSVHGLCAGLVRQGIEVSVFTTNVDGEQDSDVPLGQPVDVDGVQVTYHRSRRLRRLYYSPDLARSLRAGTAAFDVVHLHSVFLWPTWYAARVARRRGVPYLVSPKGMLVRDLVRRKNRLLKRLWIGLLERRTLERAAGIQVSSRRESDELRAFGFRTEEPFVVPHGLDLSEIEVDSDPMPPGAGLRARLLYLGRISWEKGLDRLIPALKFVPDVELVLAGNDENGYGAVLLDLAREHGVERRVVFHPPVRDRAKWELLAGATLVVLPSYSESFGMAVLEAMAVGRPVAVTAEVGLSPVVAEVDSGIVMHGAPERMGPAIDALLAEPEALVTKGRNGRRAVEARFTWDSVARRMLREYERITARS